jgi:hypothetical protein
MCPNVGSAEPSYSGSEGGLVVQCEISLAVRDCLLPCTTPSPSIRKGMRSSYLLRRYMRVKGTTRNGSPKL